MLTLSLPTSLCAPRGTACLCVPSQYQGSCSRQPILIQIDGGTQTLGGRQQCTEAILRSVLARFHNWVKLVREVIRAELPEFETFSSFTTILRLDDEPSATELRDAIARMASVLGIPDTVSALLEDALSFCISSFSMHRIYNHARRKHRPRVMEGVMCSSGTAPFASWRHEASRGRHSCTNEAFSGRVLGNGCWGLSQIYMYMGAGSSPSLIGCLGALVAGQRSLGTKKRAASWMPSMLSFSAP